MSSENADIVRRSGVIVYLEAPEETLLQRMVSDRTNRSPLIGYLVEDHRNNQSDMATKAKAIARIKDLLEQRLATYKIADIEIGTKIKTFTPSRKKSNRYFGKNT